jgi:cytochrome c-type biogenesis protein CcmE
MIDEMVASDVETPRRRKVPWSFIVAGLAVAGAVTYLIFASTSATAAYYMTINELRACHDCTTRAVRVAGVVAAGSITHDDSAQTLRFVVTQGRDALPVTYSLQSGAVPDIFRPGITVVVEGKLLPSGVFAAQTLLAKCPSRFQSATPGASSS